MLGKLMKYELRYLIRIFGPMWLLVIGLCGLGRISTPELFYFETETLSMLLMIAAIVAVVVMSAICSIVLLQRFYKGMYGDEGYLMFTLPVTTGALINAKGFSAILMGMITSVVAVGGWMLLFSHEEIWSSVVVFGAELFASAGITGFELFMVCFWMLMMVLSAAAGGVYNVYLAISMGQLWRKHPIAGAILAYYAMSMVLSALENFVLTNFGGDLYSAVESLGWVMGRSDVEVLIIFFIVTMVINLALAVLSFIGTKLLMDKKLNIA